MGQNQFVESLVEVMLSWMRWLTSWFWNIINSEGTSGGFLGWFSDNWKSLAVFLIVAGVIVDWIIWMIRWRPYWIWTRKRQIIYEEVPVHKKERRPAPRKPVEQEDYDDPFAEAENDPYRQKKSLPGDELAEWDSPEDPYAETVRTKPASAQPHFYGRPKLGRRSDRK